MISPAGGFRVLSSLLRPLPGFYDNPVMVLESLLLSNDSQVLEVLPPALHALKIEVAIRRDVHAGTEAIGSAHYDAVIVDCEGLSEGLDLLQALRQGKSNRSAIAFALLDDMTPSDRAFDCGANSILRKPISSADVFGCFGAALGLMERERRRYFRHALEMPVRLLFKGDAELKARAINLSETGMAIQLTGLLPAGEVAGVMFCLPGTELSIKPRAELVWADGTGRAGVRFFDMAPNFREQLDRWLFEQSEKLDRA